MLEVADFDGIFIARLKDISRFNSIISQSVKDELNKIMSERGTKLIFDLEGIKFIDSSAFGTLISILKTSKINNGIFKICNVTPDVQELISVMQLDTVFEICTSVDNCIASFNS